MNADDVREIIMGRQLVPPYSICTRSGDHYRVESHANVFIPDAYPDTLIIVIPHRGLVWLGLATIDGLHIEHEPEN
jgi:hypothetical protein